MSNAAHAPEQDVGGDDGLPTYDNLAQAHGPNSRYGNYGPRLPHNLFDPLVPQVRSMEKLGRKEVSSRPPVSPKVLTFKELLRGTPTSLRRKENAGSREVGVMA